MSATAIKLLEVSEVREAMGIDHTRDSEVDSLILEVSSLWEAQTNRLWGLRTDYEFTTELAWDEKILNLPLYPLTSLIVVSWAQGETEPSLDTASERLTLDTDYSLISESGEFTYLLTTGSNWFFNDWSKPDHYFKFRVTGGYTAATLQSAHPNGPVIKQALIEQIKYQQQRNTAERVANTSQVVGEASASLRSNTYHPQFRSAVRMFGNSMIL